MKGFALLILVICSWSCYSQEFLISFISPSPNNSTGRILTDSIVNIVTIISSTNKISTVIASVGNIEQELSKRPRFHGSYIDTIYVGTISIAGVKEGPLLLTVTVTDIFNNTGSDSISIFYDNPPHISVSKPQNESIAGPVLEFSAKCFDTNSSTCNISLNIQQQGFSNSTISTPIFTLVNGKNLIQGDVDLSKYEGTLLTLWFEATDSLNQVTKSRFNTIYVESSPYLKKIADVESKIEDFDGNRILYLNQIQPSVDKSLPEILTIQTQEVTTIPFPIDTVYLYGSGDSYQKVFRNIYRLTQTGSLFSRLVSQYDGKYSYDLYEWNGSEIKYFSTASSYDIPALGVIVKGDYSIWSTTCCGLYRRKFSDDSTTLISNDIYSYPWADVAENGEVVFRGNNYEVLSGKSIYSWKNKITTKISNDNNSDYSFPVLTDGTQFLYGAITTDQSAPFTTTMTYVVNDSLTENPLANFVIGHQIIPQINNGFIAYGKTSGATDQIWIREPAGSENQITFFQDQSEVELLTKIGDISFTTPSKVTYTSDIWQYPILLGGGRFISDKLGHSREVGSSLGKAFWADNKWWVTLGRTLLEVDTLIEKQSVSDINKSTPRDSVLTFSKLDFLNATNGPGELLKLSILELPKHGHLELNGTSIWSPIQIERVEIDNLKYLPDTHYAGNDSFTWKAFNGIEMTPATANVNINIALTTEVKDSISNSITIYPNPAKSHLVISFSYDPQDKNVTIFNLLGQIVLSRSGSDDQLNQSDFELEINNLIPGVYIVRAQSGEHTKTERIIKY